MNNYHHISMALGGIVQVCLPIPLLAEQGYCDNQIYQHAVETLFVTEPPTTEAVFGQLAYIAPGLTKLHDILLSNTNKNISLVKYVFGVLVLASKINKKSDALAEISTRLTKLSYLASEVNQHETELTHSLANIYTSVISPIGPRIQVTGKIEMLQNTYIQAKIRTLLFAGVRAGILWQQVGGRRWQFIFNRKKLHQATADLLQTLS